MKLFTELNENVQVLSESVNGEKKYFIEGIFLQSNVKNRNGRVYPKEVMQKEVNRYMKEMVEKNRAYGELGHPEGPNINFERVSHMITSLKESGNDYIGKAKIITNNPYGAIVKNLLDEGGVFGVSSRGMGSLKESNGVNIVQSDFMLATAADIVADPSAPDAYVRGLMEGKEWIWENGILSERVIDSHKKIIQKASSAVLEVKMEAVFRDFLRGINGNR
jgi:hypothetical protein